MSNADDGESSSKSVDDDDQLADKITTLAAQINAGTYRLLKMIAEFDRREAWGGYGIRSCAHWLNLQCGIAMNAARERVRVARALEDLPGINTAFEKGELSYSKARAMTRVATAENENYLLMIAEHGTAQHMEKLVRMYKLVKKQSDFEESDDIEVDQQKSRDVFCYQDESGMWNIHAKLPAEEGGLLVKALNEIGDRLAVEAKTETDAPIDGAEKVTAETFSADKTAGADTVNNHSVLNFEPRVDQEAEPPSMGQRRADALAALAEHFLADGGGGAMNSLKGAERCQLILHVKSGFGIGTGSSAGSTEGSGTASCDCEAHLDGHWLSPDAAQRLACDASLVVVEEDDAGNVLNIGRRSRIIPPALHRALAIRDGGCQFPGCCETRYVDGHHIKHWGEFGETELDNLVSLCRYHHRELHRGSFFLSLKPATQQPQAFADRLHFTKGSGNETIERNPVRFTAASCDFSELQNTLPADINAQTAVSKWLGEQMDFGLGVEGLLDADGCRENPDL